jgi:hypothetical protein
MGLTSQDVQQLLDLTGRWLESTGYVIQKGDKAGMRAALASARHLNSMLMHIHNDSTFAIELEERLRYNGSSTIKFSRILSDLIHYLESYT